MKRDLESLKKEGDVKEYEEGGSGSPLSLTIKKMLRKRRIRKYGERDQLEPQEKKSTKPDMKEEGKRKRNGI